MSVSNTPNAHESTPFGPPPCHTCNLRPANDPRRNLIVCIQSMLHSPWTASPNVQYMFESVVETNHLKHLPRQLKYMPPTWVVHTMRAVVEDTYGWLARTYSPGDQIYLFGFGRGAYEARALAAMIYEVGLIRDPNAPKNQIYRAYDLYESNRSQPSSQTRKNASQFKHDKCWKDLRVHFVGAWDTMSPIERKWGGVLPVSSPLHTCHFRHALAIDEDRDRLHPEYIQGTVYSNLKHSDDIDTCDVKEVWFEGDHFDLGGGRVQESHHQLWDSRPQSLCGGNVPLMWMHQEASENGLILAPLDLHYFPSDCYFLPRQVLPSRSHSSQLRCILPGQKVHTSVLLNMKYRCKNTLIDNIPSIQCPDIGVDNDIWEPTLFSDTLVRQLIDCSQDDPIPYPRKLLYLLQFKQGKARVQQMPGCRQVLKEIIKSQLEQSRTWEIKAFTVCFAYWVAFFEEATDSLSPTDLEERGWILRVLGQALKKHIDSSNQIFYPPLIRDKVLRERFLKPKRVTALMAQLDGDARFVSSNPRVHDFGRWTEVVADLVSCEHLREIVIEELNVKHTGFSQSRLARMLKTSDSKDLTAALCIVQTLSRSPQGTSLCVTVRPRLRELTATRGHIGRLAAEALISLRISEEVQNETESVRFCRNLYHPNIRAGFLFACSHWNMVKYQVVSPEICATSHRILDHISTTAAETVSATQQGLLYVLLLSTLSRSKGERTAATFTLLKLCENARIRMWLLEVGILGNFVEQLMHHDASLLAAYAILVCLKYDNLKQSIDNDNRVPGYLARMVRLDYFNNWLGQIEGFQILGELMKDDVLGRKLEEHGMMEVLESKLYASRCKDTWRKLAYPQSNLLRCFDKNVRWTDELVKRGLERLELKEWSGQKVGVAVLAALAQTADGVNAIEGRVHDIVKLLLDARNDNLKLRSVLGPACALRVLSENETLRRHVREIEQYTEWKVWYLRNKDNYPRWNSIFFIPIPFEVPREFRNRAPWHVKTPTLGDVQTVLNEAIRAIDEEFSDGEFLPVEETLPPHIGHWRRLLVVVPIAAGLGAYMIVMTPYVIALSVASIPVATAVIMTTSPMSLRSAGVPRGTSVQRRRGGSGNQDDGEDSVHAETDDTHVVV